MEGSRDSIYFGRWDRRNSIYKLVVKQIPLPLTPSQVDSRVTHHCSLCHSDLIIKFASGTTCYPASALRGHVKVCSGNDRNRWLTYHNLMGIIPATTAAQSSEAASGGSSCGGGPVEGQPPLQTLANLSPLTYPPSTGHNVGQQAGPFIYGEHGQIQNQLSHGGAQPAFIGHQMLAGGGTPLNYGGQGQIQNQPNHGLAQPLTFGDQSSGLGDVHHTEVFLRGIPAAIGGGGGGCGGGGAGDGGGEVLMGGQSEQLDASIFSGWVYTLTVHGCTVKKGRKECCDVITCGECIDNMKQRGRGRLECGCGEFVYELDKRPALSAASDGRVCQGCLRRIIVISAGASGGLCSKRIDSSGSWKKKPEFCAAGSGARGLEKKRNNGGKKSAVQLKTERCAIRRPGKRELEEGGVNSVKGAKLPSPSFLHLFPPPL